MKILMGCVATLAILFVLFYWLPFGVWKFETSKGEHTGYVTAIEKSGVFFKTGTAYVKTDTMSSQEDQYCVIDPEVYSQLQQFAAAKTHVDLFYVSWIKVGIQNCNGESAIIYKVAQIQ